MSKAVEPVHFRIGVLADLHYELDSTVVRSAINRYEQAEVEARLEAAVEIFDDAEVDAVAVLGDVAELGDARALHRVFALLREASAPVAVVRGNHDCGTLRAAAARYDVRMLAEEPFSAGALRLVGIDAVPIEPGLPMFESAGAPSATGGLTVVASHFPVLSQALLVARAGLPYHGDLVDRAEVARALAAAEQPVVVVNGHIHARCSAAEATLLQLSVGAVVEPPFDCTVVDVDACDSPVVTRTAVRLGSVAAVNPVFAPDDERWLGARGGWVRDPVWETLPSSKAR